MIKKTISTRFGFIKCIDQCWFWFCNRWNWLEKKNKFMIEFFVCLSNTSSIACNVLNIAFAVEPACFATLKIFVTTVSTKSND